MIEQPTYPITASGLVDHLAGYSEKLVGLPQHHLGFGFGGDDDNAGGGETLRLFVGDDTAQDFTPLGPMLPGTTVRDPDIIYLNDLYWLVYTQHGFGVAETTFGLQSSPDLVHWTALMPVTVNPGSAAKRVWGPTWVEDARGAGLPSVIVAVTTTDSDTGNFVMYEVHPTDDTMTAWSAPAVFT